MRNTGNNEVNRLGDSNVFFGANLCKCNKKRQSFDCLFCYLECNYICLVAVMRRLIWTFNGHSNIGCLLLGEFCKFCTELFKMQSRNFFI